MCMGKFQLQRLVAEGEHSRLEFKERPGKDIAAVVSGFANAGGGRILVWQPSVISWKPQQKRTGDFPKGLP